MEEPYLLSPPRVPVAGATDTSQDTVKVMAYHGILYSHSGLKDPAMMPECATQVKPIHAETMKWAGLDMEVAKMGRCAACPESKESGTWATIRKLIPDPLASRGRWWSTKSPGNGNPHQAHLLPRRAQQQGEKKKSTVRLKRGLDAASDEAQAKKGSAPIPSDHREGH